jgi:uncharacterized protein YvpB
MPTASRPSGRSPLARPRWTGRVSALLVSVIVAAFLGTVMVVDSKSATELQRRALALHERWGYMRDNGVPASELDGLEREWRRSQASFFIGPASVFWLPGAGPTVNRWEGQTDAIWSGNVALRRGEAVAAADNLHRVLGNESYLKQKVRLMDLDGALTPLDFMLLRNAWNLEAQLVPIDRAIAASVAQVHVQVQRSTRLGIRSDPASRVLVRATAYATMDDTERIVRWDELTRDLAALRGDLEDRLDAAVVTSEHLDRTSHQVFVASLYGIRAGGFSNRVAQARAAFGSVLTVAAFKAITEDLKQIYSEADHAIRVVLQQTHIVRGVPMIFQNHPLSCEEAATSMALAHQGIHVSQDQILHEIGADTRSMYVDGAGRVRWGNPYRTFVGNVNGSESNYTGFGTFYPPLVRVARAHGAKILAYGTMSAATIYARLIAGHPVVVFSTWDWRWHPRRDYLSFDGRWIPWIGPVYASHVYTAVGVGPTRVLINDPIRGQYWISKAAFEAGYSDFREAIVFA